MNFHTTTRDEVNTENGNLNLSTETFPSFLEQLSQENSFVMVQMLHLRLILKAFIFELIKTVYKGSIFQHSNI